MDNQTKSSTFSTLRHDQKHLVIKTDGKPFVVAEVYLEHFAEKICKLLNEAEQAEGEEKAN